MKKHILLTLAALAGTFSAPASAQQTPLPYLCGGEILNISNNAYKKKIDQSFNAYTTKGGSLSKPINTLIYPSRIFSTVDPYYSALSIKLPPKGFSFDPSSQGRVDGWVLEKRSSLCPDPGVSTSNAEVIRILNADRSITDTSQSPTSDRVKFPSSFSITGNGGIVIDTPGNTVEINNASYTGGTEVIRGNLSIQTGGTLNGTANIILGRGSNTASLTNYGTINSGELRIYNNSQASNYGLLEINKASSYITNYGMLFNHPSASINIADTKTTSGKILDYGPFNYGYIYNEGSIEARHFFNSDKPLKGSLNYNLTYYGKYLQNSNQLPAIVHNSDQGIITTRGNFENKGFVLNEGLIQANELSNRKNAVVSISGAKARIKSDILNNGLITGTGTVQGNLYNEGTTAPGNSIGTLTIDGDYIQGLTNSNASLEIEVDGSTSDLLKITGDNRTVLLGGNLNISSIQGTHITPNQIYTAIDVTGQGATGGELNLKTDLSGVVGSSGYLFARETSPAFATVNQSYYNTCTSSDPDIQKNCTKLQFAWLQVAKEHKPSQGTKHVATPTGTVAVVTPTKTKSPSTIIKQVKQTGGAITTASSGNSSTNTDTCTANTGNAAACQQQNKPGSGKNASNANNNQVARLIDAGQASLGVVVSQTNSSNNNNSSTGKPVKVNGVNSGYTTNQTKQAKVTPDFVAVYNALFSIPTRVELNQALHSITAEPYASMQSVALEAMEQFGKNSLALTDRAVPLTHTQTFCRLDDGTLIPADSPERPDTCDERKKTVGSRWSLLLDGTNTEASLDGTTELASLDYNVFSTIYGLQYAFSPQWSAGAAFGYGQTRLYNYEYANAHINADTYGGSIWGIYRPSADWKISGLLGYMNLQYDSTRQMTFGGLNRTANANWDGNGFTTALEAQYNWALNGDSTDPNAIRLKPRTYLSYAAHNQGSFSESGAQSLNLAVDSHIADSVLWGLGFTLETPIRISSTNRIIPRFTVGYEHDFMGSADEEHQLTSSFSELPALGSMDVLGQNRGADALDLGLSIEIATSDSVSLYAAVNGGFWSNGNEISYGGGLKYSW